MEISYLQTLKLKFSVECNFYLVWCRRWPLETSGKSFRTIVRLLFEPIRRKLLLVVHEARLRKGGDVEKGRNVRLLVMVIQCVDNHFVELLRCGWDSDIVRTFCCRCPGGR